MGIVARSSALSFQAKGWCALLLSLFLLSCGTSVTVKPDLSLSDNHGPTRVKGNITYKGNPIYLPATVEHKSGTDVTIHYEYVLSYAGTGEAEFFTAFIPTTIVGTPTGGDWVTAVGKMEISRNGTVIKTYSGEVLVSKPRSLFAGGSDKTELRRQALTSLKESIELQMKNDFSLLAEF
jgi:hypothetical protein